MKVKDCPFCGGQAKTAGIADDNKVAYCSNVKCNLYQMGFPIDFWNTRKETDEIL